MGKLDHPGTIIGINGIIIGIIIIDGLSFCYCSNYLPFYSR